MSDCCPDCGEEYGDCKCHKKPKKTLRYCPHCGEELPTSKLWRMVADAIQKRINEMRNTDEDVHSADEFEIMEMLEMVVLGAWSEAKKQECPEGEG